MKSEHNIKKKINDYNEEICRYNRLLVNLEADKKNVKGQTYVLLRNLYHQHIEKNREKIELLLWVIE